MCCHSLWLAVSALADDGAAPSSLLGTSLPELRSEPAEHPGTVVRVAEQAYCLSAGRAGAEEHSARAVVWSAMHPCRVVQSARAPGCVFVLGITSLVKMVTPHAVHMLSQLTCTVYMRRHGH